MLGQEDLWSFNGLRDLFPLGCQLLCQNLFSRNKEKNFRTLKIKASKMIWNNFFKILKKTLAYVKLLLVSYI